MAAVAEAASAQAMEQAHAQYRRILEVLAAAQRLDGDQALLERVRRILMGLARAAAATDPATAEWEWEAHITNDPGVDALCVAGGKVLIGSGFVARLELDDAELATLIAHEAGHAIADHRHPAPSGPMEMDVSERLRLLDIAFRREREADETGMRLAHRAGWPAEGIVRFYEKLAASQAQATYSSTHPHAASRLEHAREIADSWAKHAR